MPESQFTPAYEKLVAALVEMRHRAQLTQRDLADRLGREQSYVGRIETGQRRIDLVETVWWCHACDADAEKEVLAVVKSIGKKPRTNKRQK